jgi:hypothetical protein
VAVSDYQGSQGPYIEKRLNQRERPELEKERLQKDLKSYRERERERHRVPIHIVNVT